MSESRTRNAKLNIIVSMVFQVVTILCGLIMPRLMLQSYGAEAYGAVASITQFLSYITLLEGGIGGVARAAFYKPLAEKDYHTVGAIISEVKRFFRIVAYFFVAYVGILSVGYKYISGISCFDLLSTALLVVAISIATFAQYFIGISYSVLLNAAQKSYIIYIISIGTTIINTVISILLIQSGCSLIIVKLISSIVFVAKPVLLWMYVEKHYNLPVIKKNNVTYLEQKWTGLGQHIAYFLYSNTDIAVLTVLVNLTSVAIYSVYNMVISHIQNFVICFASGMEAVFGDMIAKGETEQLKRAFGYYDTLISIISVILYSTTSVLIVPFVLIYTSGLENVSYSQPLFAILITLATMSYCLRQPYNEVVIAAGHFRQTKFASYGEAIINITLSLVFVHFLGLAGVAVGTLVATIFRFLFYIFYIKNNIVYMNLGYSIKRIAVNYGCFFIINIIGYFITNKFIYISFGIWIKSAIIVTPVSIICVLIFNFVFYREDIKAILKKVRVWK